MKITLEELLTANQCGYRGCCGMTKRKGAPRYCAQKPIVTRDGKQYCYYHDPVNPKKFGERKTNE